MFSLSIFENAKKEEKIMFCYAGQILLLSYNWNLVDLIPCDGRTLPISQYQMLYALIGNRYGGDGRSNFMVPKMNGMLPHSRMMFYIAANGVYPTRP
jgi:Microcystin-dependent protein